MRPALAIKTLFRTPVRTFLTFIIFAVVSFSFFSRVAEYLITNREIKNAAKEYRGVGSAEIIPASESYPDSPFYINADPRVSKNFTKDERDYYLNKLRYQPLSLDQINSILKLPYISSSSTRYMTPGISDRYFRLDEGKDYYNYTNRFVVEGTLSAVDYGNLLSGGSFNDLTIDDCTLLAGNPPLNESGKMIIHAFPDKLDKNTSGSMGGSRTIAMFDDSYICDTEYVKSLAIGSRYIFVGRFENLDVQQDMFFLGDILANRWCDAIQPIDGQPANYLETEQFAPLRELIDLTNSDLHTFDVVYTDDLSSIMRFAEGNMSVVNGRGLTKEDSLNKSSVCIISREFASGNHLNPGDKINLNLGTGLFEQYKGLGAIAASRERYSRPNKAAELEIVGIYTNTDGAQGQFQKPNWSYSINTVFVPKSLLLLDEIALDDHMFSPGEFSFVVDDAWNIASFIEKATPAFKEMVLTLIFSDGGWPEIVDEFKMSQKLSIIAIIALSAAVVAATGLIVFLFIGRKKKEYAIMRALGTTAKKSASALIIPLMAVSVLAVLAGSCTAWIYTASTIAKTNDALAKIKEYAVNTSIPVMAAIACIMGEIILVLVFAWFGLRRIGAIPPLMLLQEKQNKQARGKRIRHKKPPYFETKAYAESAALSETLTNNIPGIGRELTASDCSVSDAPNPDGSISGVPYEKRKTNIKGYGQVFRYIAKHVSRSTVKSLLTVLLAVLLIGAVGQFAAMRQSYITLCKNTEIKAKFINGLHLAAIKQLTEAGYVINPYYEYRHYVEINNMFADMVVTNDIGHYTGENAEITYAAGYDESCMGELGNICIVGDQLLNKNALKPGDKIQVTMPGTLQYLQNLHINEYRADHRGEEISYEEILELYKDKIAEEISHKGTVYTIAGSINTPSGRYDETVFSPGTLYAAPILGFEIPLDLAEFTLADNLRADEFRNYATGLAGGNKNSSNTLTFVMDTSKIDNLLEALSLLEKLYPVVVLAAVLIGGFLCGLIIIQAAKETAIMRVLGTTRLRSCIILVIEQVFLCTTGLLLGMCGLLVYNGTPFAEIASKIYVFTALYFAGCLAVSVICSLLTTRRKVLELLQTKE